MSKALSLKAKESYTSCEAADAGSQGFLGGGNVERIMWTNSA